MYKSKVLVFLIAILLFIYAVYALVEGNTRPWLWVDGARVTWGLLTIVFGVSGLLRLGFMATERKAS